MMLGQRLNIVLDIDETLLTSSLNGKFNNPNFIELSLPDFTFENQNANVQVFLRPHLKYFLQQCLDLYNVYFFTASTHTYADAVLNSLEERFDMKGQLSRRLYRHDCTFVNGHYCKDLRKITGDLSNCLLIDNSIIAMQLQPKNGILIPDYNGNPIDNNLLKTLEYIELVHRNLNHLNQLNEFSDWEIVTKKSLT